MKKLAMIGGTLVGTAIVIAVIFGTLIYLGYSIPNPFETPTSENGTQLTAILIFDIDDGYGHITTIDTSHLSSLATVTFGGVAVGGGVQAHWIITATATVNGSAAAGTFIGDGTYTVSSPFSVAAGKTLVADNGSNSATLGGHLNTLYATATKSQLESLGSGSHTLTFSVTGSITATGTAGGETVTGSQSYSASSSAIAVVTPSTISIIVAPSFSSSVGT